MMEAGYGKAIDQAYTYHLSFPSLILLHRIFPYLP